MSLLRCLRPSGGATALTAVIGGPALEGAGYAFPFVPVGINSLILILTGVAFYRPPAIPVRIAPFRAWVTNLRRPGWASRIQQISILRPKTSERPPM
jgi:hypothetical protein